MVRKMQTQAKMPENVVTETSSRDIDVLEALKSYKIYDSTANAFGIDEEPEGKLPIYVEPMNGALGVTAFSEDSKPVYVSINRDRPFDRTERITHHELDHVKSSKILIKYMDMPDEASALATALIEGYPEFRRFKFWFDQKDYERADRVAKWTPYKGALYLAGLINRYYIGKSGTEFGYTAFIKDIKREKSVKKVFDRFIAQYKAKMN